MQTDLFIKKRNQVILTAVLLLGTGSVLIWRSFYGMDLTDETFYLAAARRFYDGAMVFKDDWNRGQLFGLLMLPFYSIYMFIQGNNEGIILCSRILFVILELFVAAFLWKILIRNTGSFGAALSTSLCVLVYARGNIITMSYYNLGFLTFLLAVLWWSKAERGQEKKLFYLLSGFNFAVSVVCMPYMVLLFFVLLGVGIFWRLKNDAVRCRRVFWWFAGILFAAVVFLLYFGRLIPWKELQEYVPIIFQDPGLEKDGILEQFLNLFRYIGTVFLKYTWPVYAVTFVLSVLDGKRVLKNEVIHKLLPWLLAAEFFVQSIYVRTYFEGGVVLVLFLLALQMQFLYPEHRLKWMEHHFLIPGLLFAVPWVLGSNVGERVINMSILLMDIWGICFLWTVFQRHQRKNCYLAIKISVFWMFMVLFLIRIFDVYRDGSIERLNYSVSCGCMKGIYTEENRGNAYEQMVNLLLEETDDKDRIVTPGTNPWVYLDAPASCGAYTVWNFDNGESVLRQYYEKFPEYIPDKILLVPEEVSVYESWRFSSHGSGWNREEQAAVGGILGEIIESGNYVCLEKSGAKLYSNRL